MGTSQFLSWRAFVDMDDNLGTIEFIWTELSYEVSSRKDLVPPPHSRPHRNCRLESQSDVTRPAVIEPYREWFFIRLNRFSSAYTN